PLVNAALADLGFDLVSLRLPCARQLNVAMHLSEPRATVAGDPAHELGRHEVLRLAADLPDSAVRLLPVLDRRIDRSLEDRPNDLGEEIARLRVPVHRIEHSAPDVDMHLPVSSVAHTHGVR